MDAQLPDVEAGKRFYGELFGWTFEENGGPGAGPARPQPVAALAPKPDGRMPTVWTVYFSTPDAYALAARIRAAGGQVITAPVPVRDLGTAALATDPDGAVFGLWQAGHAPRIRPQHEPGTYCWTEVYTRDTRRVNTFYGEPLPRAPLVRPGRGPPTSAGPPCPTSSRRRCRRTSWSTSPSRTADRPSARCNRLGGPRPADALRHFVRDGSRSSPTIRGRRSRCSGSEPAGSGYRVGVESFANAEAIDLFAPRIRCRDTPFRTGFATGPGQEESGCVPPGRCAVVRRCTGSACRCSVGDGPYGEVAGKWWSS